MFATEVAPTQIVGTKNRLPSVYVTLTLLERKVADAGRILKQ